MVFAHFFLWSLLIFWFCCSSSCWTFFWSNEFEVSRGWFSFLILLNVEDDRDHYHEILKQTLDTFSVFILSDLSSSWKSLSFCGCGAVANNWWMDYLNRGHRCHHLRDDHRRLHDHCHHHHDHHLGHLHRPDRNHHYHLHRVIVVVSIIIMIIISSASSWSSWSSIWCCPGRSRAQGVRKRPRTVPGLPTAKTARFE